MFGAKPSKETLENFHNVLLCGESQLKTNLDFSLNKLCFVPYMQNYESVKIAAGMCISNPKKLAQLESVVKKVANWDSFRVYQKTEKSQIRIGGITGKEQGEFLLNKALIKSLHRFRKVPDSNQFGILGLRCQNC